MADLSQPNNLFSEPNDHLSHLLAPEMDEPWYKSFFQNINDMVNPPKLPPLVLTSKPVPVKDIWGLPRKQPRSRRPWVAAAAAVTDLRCRRARGACRSRHCVSSRLRWR